MSGLGFMVVTLLLLVPMATSQQDGGEKQAMQRDAINVAPGTSITRTETDQECIDTCKQEDKKCCGRSNGVPTCAKICLG
uniref:Conotoxin Di6.11 n=1 Tax=Conus distans TaxID=72281 RepID=M9PM89_CONDI|nr:conotoxin Di6.11 [Conus distans]